MRAPLKRGLLSPEETQSVLKKFKASASVDDVDCVRPTFAHIEPGSDITDPVDLRLLEKSDMQFHIGPNVPHSQTIEPLGAALSKETPWS